MKLEMEVSWQAITKLLVVGIVGIAIGYGLALATVPEPEPVQALNENYLTSSDLNRSDIQASILLSRFCEGLGFNSGIYWQQDAEGNVFGTPICLPPQQAQ